jgi:long-chain acyl-CoA synthetase
MMGYYKNPQATSLAIQDGWLYTGDLARKDKEGYYYITGRSKNLIVSAAGKNIYPEEVEAHLLKSPYIAEVMVLGVLNLQTKREEVQAIIYPNSETLDSYAKANHKTLTPEDVERIIGEEVHKQCLELADYKRVKKFQLRSEEFPKTAIKKIKRYLVAGKPVAVKGESPKT